MQTTLTTRDRLKGKWIILATAVLGILVTVATIPFLFGFVQYELNSIGMDSLMYDFQIPPITAILHDLFPIIPMLLLIAYALFLHKTPVGNWTLTGMFACCAVGSLCGVIGHIITFIRFAHMLDLGTLVDVAWDGALMIVFAVAAVMTLLPPKAHKIGGIACMAVVTLAQFASQLSAVLMMVRHCLQWEIIGTQMLSYIIGPLGWLLFCIGLLLVYALNAFPPTFGKAAPAPVEDAAQ